MLKKHAELVYISAPHVIPTAVQQQQPDDDDEISSEAMALNDDAVAPVIPEQLGWYFSTPSLTFNYHDVTDHSTGLEESLEVVNKAFQGLGPFDGILGFSQGATLASILCDLLEKGKLSFTFKFAILVSGFKSRLSPHSHFFEVKKTIPTLHVIGETDRIVEKGITQTKTLMHKFKLIFMFETHRNE